MPDKDYGLKWGPLDRGDRYILNESSYTRLFDPKNTFSLCPGDTWMDIGAHFGSFALRASQRVRRVIAVEPAPVNIAKLENNLRLNWIRNVEIVEAAVVGGSTREVNLALGRTFDYTHRVGYVRGRRNATVQGVNVNELVSRYAVNAIKMDCEGSEEEILQSIDYAPIDEIIFEWHFTLIPDRDWSRLRSALDRLKAEGFEILRAPVDLTKPTKRWTAIIWARKRGGR